MGLFRQIRQRALRTLPLGALGRLAPRNVIGLHYHAVSDARVPHIRHLLRPKTPEQFECDLLFLKQSFRLLSYPEVREELANPRTAGRPGVVLTFDDGYAECFSVVRPLLRKHGVPCIFFVTTGFLDNCRLYFRNKASLCIEAVQFMGGEFLPLRELSALAERPIATAEDAVRWLRARDIDEHRLDRACALFGIDEEAFLRRRQPYLTTAQVQQLAAEGFTIGAHTRTHPQLARLGRRAAEEEIIGSCEDVSRLTGAAKVPFAFPFTGKNVDRAMLAGMRDAHPVADLLFDTQRLRRDRSFILHRIPVDQPPEGGGNRTTLPDDLRSAYLNQVGRAAGEWLRGTRRGTE